LYGKAEPSLMFLLQGEMFILIDTNHGPIHSP
jgi:hypothetical protein